MNLITLMIIIVPSTTALVDCRTACRTCRQKIDTSSLLEVYCAMCEECKSRRRERLRSRTDEGKQNKSHETSKDTTQHERKCTTKTRGRDSASADKEYQHHLHSEEIAAPLSQGQYRPNPQPSYPENPPEYIQDPHSPSAYKLQPSPEIYYPVSYPSGCPTPPQCSESEEEYNPQQLSMQTEKITLPTTTTTRTTTTSTTTKTTKQPCPRIAHCKKKRRNPRIPYATRPVPEIRYIPQPPPPLHFIPQPYPCMSPCLPPMLDPRCPCPQYQPPALIQLPPYQPFPPPINLPSYQPQTERTSIQPLYLPDPTKSQRPTPVISTTMKERSTTRNFFYVYLGVPKKVLSL